MPSTEKKPTATIVKVILLFVLLIILGLIFEAAQREHKSDAVAQDADKTQTLTLNAQRPASKTVTVQKKYIGFVTPVHDVGVLPFISGFIDDVRVKGGQNVKKGEVLVVLQQQEYLAQMNAAKAAVAQAEAVLKNAKSYYSRVKSAGTQAVSAADADTALANYSSAQAALAQAKADYDLAKVNYNYTVIKAPISGVVGDVSLTKGQYVSPAGAALFEIVQTTPIRVVFSISDKEYVDFLQTPDALSNVTVRLKLANNRFYPSDGILKFTDNALNRQTNSLAVYADFDNPDRWLIANAYVTVFLEKEYANSVLISQKSVSFSPDGTTVQVVNNGTVSSKPVDVIAVRDNAYVVKNTFHDDDFVLLSPLPRLPAGKKISLNVISDQKE